MDVVKSPHKVPLRTTRTSHITVPINPVARVYQFGSFLLDQAERRLLHGRTALELRPKAFDLLLVLVESAGHLVTKETLLEKVWPDAFVEEANLSVNITMLRRALGERTGGQHYIETVRKLGYRFVAEVVEVDGESALKTLGHKQDTTPLVARERRLDSSQNYSSLAVLPFENESGDPDAEYLSDGLTESIINGFSHL
jgi:DNA-binding winged helix-turn-helix (wHTH) protein